MPDEIPTQSIYKAYLVTNLITAERYVGITERRIKDRWRQHIQTARSDRGFLLHQAIEQYEPENFTCVHVASARTRYAIGKVEEELIEQSCTVEHGYNQTRGGDAGEKAGEPVDFAGKTHISLSSLFRAYGIEEWKGRQRVNRYGWTLAQALELEPRPPRRPPRSKPYFVLGKRFPSFKAAYDRYGLEESVVRSRLDYGWTKRQAFGIDPPPERGRNVGTPIYVRGKRFKSKAVAARRYRVSEDVFRDRIRKKWTPEQAAGLDPPPPTPSKEGKHVRIGDQEFISVPDFAQAFGKNPKLVAERLRRGWTPAQAVDKADPPPPSGEKTGKPITVDGVPYTSRAKAAKAHCLDPRKVHKRLKAGWNTDEAFGLKSRQRDNKS